MGTGGREDERQPGELKEDDEPYFNPREAARSYSAAAIVLAGFCFAAIVLVVGSKSGCEARCDRAVVALITAFLACVVSSFAMALIVAQMKRSERTFWLALVAGTTLATAGLFALWGVLELVSVLLARDGKTGLVSFVHFAFGVTSVIVAAFVLATAINVHRSVRTSDDALALAGGMTPKKRALRLGRYQLLACFATAAVVYLIDADGASVYWVAVPELFLLVVAVFMVLWLSTFGSLTSVRDPDAGVLLNVLVVVPPVLAAVLFALLPGVST